MSMQLPLSLPLLPAVADRPQLLMPSRQLPLFETGMLRSMNVALQQDDSHFAPAVLGWFVEHGRMDLPWQRQQNRYRVWVSEIMLQQTQVKTVMDYYRRFMARFPTLLALAEATEDEVLAHWSGLGYYARGRNLHRAARQVLAEYGGELPDTQQALMALPGIGRSTAAAILSLADGQPLAILDGNVKRVLARYHAVSGWPGSTAVQAKLWALSETVTAGASTAASRARFVELQRRAPRGFSPPSATAAFNQAMMDLGASVCRRSRPLCDACPLAAGCQAHALGTPEAFPGRKPKKELPLRHTIMLLLENPDGAWLLQRRPPSGIWGGLWSLPEIADATQLPASLAQAGLRVRDARVLERQTPELAMARLRHTFSHFRLDIDVWRLPVEIDDQAVLEREARCWHDGGELPGGVAAPVQTILNLKGEDS